MSATNETPLMSEKQRPVKSFRSGALQVAIWKQVTEDRQLFYNVTVERTFKDKKNNEFRKTNSLRENDLPKARVLLAKAYEFIMEIKE